MKNSSALIAAAALSLFAASAATAAPLLAVDINDRSTNTTGATDNPDTAPGFSPFLMPGTTAASSVAVSNTIAGYNVTLTPFDDGQDENSVTAGTQNTTGQIDDRDRTDIPNSGAFTYGQLYDDLIFAGTSTGPTGGINLSIANLAPNTQYSITLYAFDSGSNVAPQPRTATWLDANNASALVTNTSFAGGTNPTANDSYAFTGLAVTDANGTLLLLGRNTTPNAASGGVSIGVVLNGFELNAVPEPASLSLAACGLAFFTRRRRA